MSHLVLRMSEAGRGSPPKRRAGVLLHPTSLPGRYGIGELGDEALRFIEFLAGAGQTLWQVLPLNPVDKHGSPYSSASAFAGNPLLVSTDALVRDGLLSRDEAPKFPAGDGGRVDYDVLAPEKQKVLRRAFSRWNPGHAFEKFRGEHSGWLGDHALFMALAGEYGSAAWNGWPKDIASRSPEALKTAGERLDGEVRFHEFVQFRFAQDWSRVRRAANDAGVEIIGDIPIFISHDSVDVWANRGSFYLDGDGEPTVVAGVPPDYFSETGQHWGNPLYRWDEMEKNGYGWWVARVRRALELCDALRLDHFRGFEAYWEIPADEDTAVNGKWVKGPGKDIFDRLEASLGSLPLIAEDLGDITPEVRTLMKETGLPGMKILQFGFSHPENPFLPHNYDGAEWVVYTGTHDNDTTTGWWATASGKERSLARSYLGREYVGVWDFVRLAHSSRAKWCIVPMQDLLCLGSEARMNAPGTSSGNWSWRMESGYGQVEERLEHLTRVFGRLG